MYTANTSLKYERNRGGLKDRRTNRWSARSLNTLLDCQPSRNQILAPLAIFCCTPPTPIPVLEETFSLHWLLAGQLNTLTAFWCVTLIGGALGFRKREGSSFGS
ncbi:hypothetical protein CEXT_108891 [Caerostris extrusa]|uniref:Uncharacterized protein n=1 Tax=Caerostris extrusa TaxID=172846 RepID=A0AAV4UZM8_CAEEX|nr:hypothetical protein CEXT_108891 [Caerostris extrusa]